MPESVRIGESARYFVSNQPMRYGIEIVYSLEVEHCITMTEVRRGWGDTETAAEKTQRRRLEWLGHLASMPDHRIPKSTLFGWVPQPCPRCGTRKRWRDLIWKDIKDIAMNESKWYTEATGSREGWRTTCSLGIGRNTEAQTLQRDNAQEVECDVCML